MKNKNISDSFNNAFNGIIHTVKAERNMKFHVAAAAGVVITGILLRISKIEFAIVCITAASVIVCELINTAIEDVVDIIVDVYHPKAKVIKDIAAGAVLVSAFASIIVAYAVFYDRICSILLKGLDYAIRLPVNTAAAAVAVSAALAVILKLLSGKGTPFRGGKPSGHSAVAFAMSTAATLLSQNATVAFLCFGLSLLVVQGRAKARVHSIYELAAGALLGIAVTVFLFSLFGP